MKKVLLPEPSENTHYYRANLHCHSTVSDGAKTPEELKNSYRANGYSIIAYTDHNAFITHNELTDDTFLALNGYEMDVTEGGDFSWSRKRTCHMNLIALEPENVPAVCYHRTAYIWGETCNSYRDRILYNHDEPDYVREYTPACINDMMQRGRDGGFFVTYNHPVWSLESYPEYMSYNNMNAMEMCNYGCIAIGFDDDNGHVYDDMLRGGKRIFCICTDDNHNRAADDDPQCDSFGGYTMIAAPKLEYRAVTGALEAGNFYCVQSTHIHKGPEILGLTYEDGVVTVKCSPAKRVMLMTCTRYNGAKYAREGEYLTEASFRLSEDEEWFRLVVIDSEGAKAYTNAYFTDTLK